MVFVLVLFNRIETSLSIRFFFSRTIYIDLQLVLGDFFQSSTLIVLLFLLDGIHNCMFSLQATSTPSDPITLADVKAQAHILNITAEDTLLTKYISAARRHFERLTGRICRSTTFKLTYNMDNYKGTMLNPSLMAGCLHFPWWSPVFPYYTEGRFPRHLMLPAAPVSSIQSIKYYNTSDVLTTISTSDYYLDSSIEPSVIHFTTLPTDAGTKVPLLEVNFTAGYSSTPEDIQFALMHLCCYWHENRGDTKSIPQAFLDFVHGNRLGIVI